MKEREMLERVIDEWPIKGAPIRDAIKVGWEAGRTYPRSDAEVEAAAKAVQRAVGEAGITQDEPGREECETVARAALIAARSVLSEPSSSEEGRIAQMTNGELADVARGKRGEPLTAEAELAIQEIAKRMKHGEQS